MAMQYKLNSVKLVGKPGTRNIGLPPVAKYGINVLITAGIIGQTYNGFTKADAVFYELDKDQTINENDAELNTFATQYVATTYPNT